MKENLMKCDKYTCRMKLLPIQTSKSSRLDGNFPNGKQYWSGSANWWLYEFMCFSQRWWRQSKQKLFLYSLLCSVCAPANCCFFSFINVVVCCIEYKKKNKKSNDEKISKIRSISFSFFFLLLSNWIGR